MDSSTQQQQQHQDALSFQNAIPGQKQPNHDTTMQVEFANRLGSRGAVKDSSGTLMYAIDYHMRSPHVRFRDVAPINQDHEPITSSQDQGKDKNKDKLPAFGTVTFHVFRTRIDIEFRDQVKVELKCTKLLKGEYNYASPAFGGQSLTWKSASGWKSVDYVVLDERGRALARFTSQLVLTGKKIGGLQFDEELITSSEYSGGAGGSAVVDEHSARSRREEILIIGSSLAYWVMVNTTAAIS